MKIFKNIFDNELLQEIVLYHNECKKDSTQGNFWTNSSWDPGIVLDSGTVLCLDIREMFGQTLFNICNESKVFVDENGIDLGVPTDTSMMIYNWQRYSYIPFHSDNHCKIGATLFLNPFWKKNWGGAQIYVDNDRHYLEYPEFNKMCVHYTDDNDEIGHSTTMVHPGAPDRLTVQMFFRYN